MRQPTDQELETLDTTFCINMMNATPTWSLNDSMYTNDERQLRREMVTEDVRTRVNCQVATSTSRGTMYDLREYSGLSDHQTHQIYNIPHHKKGTVSPEQIASRWGIGLKSATNTYNMTMQLGVQDFTTLTGSQRLKHTAYQLKHRRLWCNMYTNTLFSDVKSLTQNTCGQIFITDFHWTCFYPLRQKGDAHEALEKLIQDHGIPNHIIPDNAPELVAGEFK